uniref:Uncharacterized protein n=1 Tax=Cacopsylla melanoneura TaxID=428564 RepID=A0A8D9A4B7_9HEMI
MLVPLELDRSIIFIALLIVSSPSPSSSSSTFPLLDLLLSFLPFLLFFHPLRQCLPFIIFHHVTEPYRFLVVNFIIDTRVRYDSNWFWCWLCPCRGRDTIVRPQIDRSFVRLPFDQLVPVFFKLASGDCVGLEAGYFARRSKVGHG